VNASDFFKLFYFAVDSQVRIAVHKANGGGQLVKDGKRVVIDDGDEPRDVPLTTIEKELEGAHRQRPKHKSHKEVHPLTAREEAGRYKRSKKAKKYDGRAYSKNAVVAREKVREALDAFYKEVKLPELKQALEVSNDPRYNMLLAAINNPRLNGCSFAELCRKCRMSIQDVVDVWRNHLKSQGLVRMMGHMPDIMEDVAIDSKSKYVTCNDCQGKGVLYGREVNKIKDPICPACHGDGTIRLLGDKDARLLAFETVGLKKGGGVGFVNVVNVNKGGVPSIEDQVANVDKIFDAEYETVTEQGITNGTIGNGTDGHEAADSRPAGESGQTGGGDEGDGDDEYSKRPDPTDYSS